MLKIGIDNKDSSFPLDDGFLFHDDEKKIYEGNEIAEGSFS